MRRLIIVLVVLFVLGSACGGDDDADPADDAADTPTAEPTAEPTDSEPAGDDAGADDEPAGDDAGADDEPAGGAIGVSLTEWAVETDTELAAGTVEFSITNDGEFPHEFVVVRADGYAALPQEASGEVIEDELEPGALLDRTERLESGESASLTVDLEPGNYVFFCNIAIGSNSHAGRGQTLDVTVS